MSELSNEFIEDAFAKIRADFEARTNVTGLEILDSYEEKWSAYGSLTDRQIDWIEKQLDGSWLPLRGWNGARVPGKSFRMKCCPMSRPISVPWSQGRVKKQILKIPFCRVALSPVDLRRSYLT